MNEMIDLDPYPLFGDFSDEEKRRVVQLCERESYNEGQGIFDEGQEGESLYLIESGDIKLFKHVAPNYYEDLVYLQQGEVFGEICFIQKGKRSSSAMAIRDCQLITLNRRGFYQLVKEESQIGYKFFSRLSSVVTNRLRITNDKYKLGILRGLEMSGATAMGLHYIITEKLDIEVGLKNDMLLSGKIMLVARGEVGYEITIKDKEDRLHIIPYHAINYVSSLP